MRLAKTNRFGTAMLMAGLAIGALGLSGCSGDDKPKAATTADASGGTVDTTFGDAGDTSLDGVDGATGSDGSDAAEVPAEAPAEMVEAIKASAQTDESIALCAAQTLIDQFGDEKALAISKLPATDTSDDRTALDQAVSDCRG
jgi:hypothetical protein